MTSTAELAAQAISHEYEEWVVDFGIDGDHPSREDLADGVLDKIDCWMDDFTGDPQMIAGVMDLRAELLKVRSTF